MPPAARQRDHRVAGRGQAHATRQRFHIQCTAQALQTRTHAVQAVAGHDHATAPVVGDFQHCLRVLCLQADPHAFGLRMALHIGRGLAHHQRERGLVFGWQGQRFQVLLQHDAVQVQQHPRRGQFGHQPGRSHPYRRRAGP